MKRHGRRVDRARSPRRWRARDSSPRTSPRHRRAARRPGSAGTGRRRAADRARRHRGAGPHERPGGAGPRHARLRRVSRPCSPAAAASSERRPPGTGCACCGHWSSRTGPGCVRAAALTPFVGWTPGRARRRRRSGHRPPRPAAAVMAGRARRSRRRCAAGDHDAVRAGRAAARRRPTASAGSPTFGTSARRCTRRRSTAGSAWRRSSSGCSGGSMRRPTTRRRSAAAAGVRRRCGAGRDRPRRKGLQFPVVYVPYGWDRYVPENPDPLRLHAGGGTRLLDVGGKDAPGHLERREAHRAEELRRGSAAALRRRSPAPSARSSRGGRPQRPPSRAPAAAAVRRLRRRPGTADPSSARCATGRARPPGRPVRVLGRTVAVEDVRRRPVGSLATGPRLTAPAGGRDLRPRAGRLGWRRTSYTGLTRSCTTTRRPTRASAASRSWRRGRQDEPATLPRRRGLRRPARRGAAHRPLADGRPAAGAAFGTLVHTVLEYVDTAAADLAAELRDRCTEAVERRFGTPVDPAALAEGLLPPMHNPARTARRRRLWRDFAARRPAGRAGLRAAAGRRRPADAPTTRPSRRSPTCCAPTCRPDPFARYASALDSPGLRPAVYVATLPAVSTRFCACGHPTVPPATSSSTTRPTGSAARPIRRRAAHRLATTGPRRWPPK